MDTCPGSPTEHEEADGDAESADKCDRKSCLRLKVTFLVELWFHPPAVVDEENGDGQEGAGKDSAVRNPSQTKAEVVNPFEGERDGLQPEVQQGVHKGNVHIENEDDGLGEGEREGANERHHHSLAGCHLPRIDLWLTFDLSMLGKVFTEALCAAVQDVGRARLG